MYNLVLVASRPTDWTYQQFITWWRGEHAEVTYPLPGLLRWQHTELLEAFGSKSEGWDGLSVLSFESREALEAALASPQWQAAGYHVGTTGGPRQMWVWREKAIVPLPATGKFSFGPRVHTLKPGDLLTLPPGAPHAVSAPEAFSMLLTQVTEPAAG